jgi:putative glutamine amidotransferase
VKPIIGITSYAERARWGAWDQPAALVPLRYVAAVEAAGGRPLIVPPVADALEETVDALDGIVFAGGSDLNPALYGAEPHPETRGWRPQRDEAELELMKCALSCSVPVLAICRGMQMLNVVRGGDLRQHLPEASGDMHRENYGEFVRHNVRVDPSSRLGAALGDRAVVASHHHQGPGRLGRDLRAVAWAPDDTVEGVEDPELEFVCGVLWHPEEDQKPALFEQLVDAARAHAMAE